MMAAAVSHVGATLSLGKPAALFPTHIAYQTFTFQYAVSDDDRFVASNQQIERVLASPITLIFNWKLPTASD